VDADHLDVTIDASVLPFSMLGNYFYFEIVNPPPGGEVPAPTACGSPS
jgi:hypothetical protein